MTTTPRHSSSRQLWATVRDDLRERRQARAAHRNLERELATYTTSAEVDDLFSALRGQEGPAVDEVREILAGNLQQRRTSRIAS